MRCIECALLAAAAVAVVGFASIASAAPVEYVQICGDGDFDVPGTTTCINANQISANQLGIAQAAAAAFTGVAMSTALVEPFVPDHANFAISVHGAAFEDKFAFGLSGLMRLEGNLMLSAGLSMAVDSGTVVINQRTETASGTFIPVQSWYHTDWLGRVGLTYSW